MNFTDHTFLKLITPRLERARWTRADVLTCRCWVCGDSATNKRKARGHFTSNGDYTNYGCFNCQISMSLWDALSQIDPYIFNEYKLAKMKEKYGDRPEREELPDASTFNTGVTSSGLIFSELPSIWSLPETHPARVAVEGRCIPRWAEVLYAKNFPKWASETIPQLIKWRKVDPHPRFVLPVFDKTSIPLGLVARAFGHEEPKYCNVNFNPEKEYLYGLDRVDKTKRTFVTEGPVDSLMIPNAIAVMSSALHKYTSPTPTTYIFDNQPRNKEVCALIGRMIRRGSDVFVWPTNVKQKDLNDLVQDGWTSAQIVDMIDTNTFSGMRAELQFNEWRRA